MHCDTIAAIMQNMADSLTENTLSIDLKKLKEADVLVQFFACFIYAPMHEEGLSKEEMNRVKETGIISSKAWDRAYSYALKMAERIDTEAKGRMKVISSYTQIDPDNKNEMYAVKTVEEGGILNGDITRLDTLYQAGIRLITLTWNFPNCIGFPNSPDPEKTKKGLTPFGIEVVNRMNELHMMIDVSHLSDGGFWDCMKYSKKPVCASHSDARALCGHKRNLTDEMIHTLGNQGGVCGLNIYPAFLRNDLNATVDDVAVHALYLIDKGGEDLPAVGTDFDGFENPYKENWLNTAADMPLLWEAMKKRGITERQLDKICYKNVLRFMNEV